MSTPSQKFLPAAARKAFIAAQVQAKQSKDVEKAVEHNVNALLAAYLTNRYKSGYDVTSTYPHRTDGLHSVRLTQGDLFAGTNDAPRRGFSVLVETKRGKTFSGSAGRPDRARVAAQVIYYLHRFQEAAEPLPSAVVVADEDEAFALPTKTLLPYLRQAHDWTISPSSAADQNFPLYAALLEDHNLSPYVERIDAATFDPEAFCARVHDLATNVKTPQKIRVDAHTLEKAFVEFQRCVFGGQTADTKTQMMIFVKSLLGDEGIYLHPQRRNTIVIEYTDSKNRPQVLRYPPSDLFTFDAAAYEAYFSKYDRSGYTLAEKKAVTEIADTLFDDFDRRFTGDFWTPQVWVREAHRLIERQLGEDWKDRYVVWDPACGSKNLTRDYRFRELYCSTLHQDELNIAEDYNPEAVSFQYDFLNDDLGLHSLDASLLDTTTQEWKLPEGLLDALRDNKPIVILANPPYGQHTNAVGKEAKVGISKTSISEEMRKAGVGEHAAKELYTQFIYRAQLLAKTFNYPKDLYFFYFFNKGFLTSPAFEKFTDNLCRQFRFREGLMLNAGEFKGTSSAWGIVFCGWALEPNDDPQQEFDFEVLRSEKVDGNLAVTKLTDWRGRRVPKDRALNKWAFRERTGERIGTIVAKSSKLQEAASPDRSRDSGVIGA